MLNESADLKLHLHQFRQRMSLQKSLRISGNLWNSSKPSTTTKPAINRSLPTPPKSQKSFRSDKNVSPRKDVSEPKAPQKVQISRSSIEGEYAPTLQDSLLDGEYDAEASQASFQAALSQWRQTYQVHTPVSHEESDPNQQSEITITTQTEISKTNEIEIDFGRSYFERLKIMNEIERGVDNLKVDASVDNVSLEGSDDGGSEECEEENEDFRNWDESDQEALDQILLKTSSNPIPILVSNERESKLPVPTWTLTCQDVTKDEEDVIMEALEKGVMVEYIPSSSLAVILS